MKTICVNEAYLRVLLSEIVHLHLTPAKVYSVLSETMVSDVDNYPQGVKEIVNDIIDNIEVEEE
jgi:phosphopantetheine adenylyltransferase